MVAANPTAPRAAAPRPAAAPRRSPAGPPVGALRPLGYTGHPRPPRKDRVLRVSLRPALPIPVVLCAAVATLLAVALALAAGPAAASPSASQIDAFLAAHDSPMVGSGAAFVSAGQQSGVDPVFLVAISGAESSFGRFLYSRNGDECTYNAFNWFYGATWPESDFASWDEAIARVAQGLAGGLYYGSGLYSVQAIAPRYCPDGTANWVANVTSFMIQLGGDPLDTRLAAGGSASTGPGLLGLSGEVELSGQPFTVGRDVTARFLLTNTGGQPVALEGVRLTAVGPGGASQALVADQPFTLAPGRQLAVTAVWPLDTVGRWSGWIEVVRDGQAGLVGDRTAFTLRVTLPQDALLRRWVRTDAALAPHTGEPGAPAPDAAAPAPGSGESAPLTPDTVGSGPSSQEGAGDAPPAAAAGGL